MKRLLILVLIFIKFSALANMASPVRRGTLGSDPFISQYVVIEHEDLYISIDSAFETVQIKVQYHINASKAGKQIPFLFYASEFLGDFSVQIDSQSVPVLSIPKEFTQAKGTKFKDFAYFFKSDSGRYGDLVLLKEKEKGAVGMNIGLKNMLYFETAIDSGQHIIEVNYKASQWKDHSDWVMGQSFRYALSPALYWKSFGILDIHLDARACKKNFKTNLGMPTDGNPKTKANWHFDKMPVYVIELEHIPDVSTFAGFLIQLGPLWIGGIAGFLLMIYHIFFILKKRREGDLKTAKLIQNIGNFLVPLGCIAACFYAYDLIYWVIGADASNQYGYHFFMWILYPILIPFYWFLIAAIVGIMTKT